MDGPLLQSRTALKVCKGPEQGTTKGLEISEGNCSVFNFPKKPAKKFLP